ANEIGHLLDFDVDKAQHLPLLHVKGGIAARRNDTFLDDRSGHRMLMQNVALRWHLIPPFFAFASTGCTSSKKRQAWRTLSIKAAGLNMQSVMRQSIKSSFAFRFGRETSGSLTPNVICENLAIMAHDKPRSRRQFIRDSGIATGLAAVSLACGARAQTKRQVTVRLDWIYQGPNAGFMVAQEKGFYEQAVSTSRLGPARDPEAPPSSWPARRRSSALPMVMLSATPCRRA